MITTSTVLPSNPSTCYCSNTRFVTEVTSALFNNACRVCTSPLCPKASQTRPLHLDIGSDSTLTLVRSVCKDILSKRRALRRLATNIFDPVGRIAKLKTHDCRPTFVVRGSLRLRRDLLSPSYDNLLLKDLVHTAVKMATNGQSHRFGCIPELRTVTINGVTGHQRDMYVARAIYFRQKPVTYFLYLG